MNQTTGQQNTTGVNSAFSSTSNPQTNPFTADLKGEFTSNFGTNTNAVSQIFKDGGFVNNNRARYIGMGVVGVVVALVLVFLLLRDTGQDDFAMTQPDFADRTGMGDITDPATGQLTDDPFAADIDSMADVDAAATGEMADTGYYEDAYAAAETQYATPTATGPISLISPASGQSWSYDETMGPAPFEWQGGGGYIVFSRSASMSPEVMRVPVSGNSYNFHNPYPGTWYWRVENYEGASQVRSFTVSSPVRRNVMVQLPSSGGTLAANGGVVEWTTDSQVAFYRVEFATGSFATPQYRFATSGNKVQVQEMAPGQYQMRVGAFSEVAGRWEYTQPMSVMVQ